MAAKFAREHKIPYLGICLGMQTAVMNQLEIWPGYQMLGQRSLTMRQESVVSNQLLSPQRVDSRKSQGFGKVEDDKGGTMRLGAYSAVLAEGSNVAKIYSSTSIEERHRHR